MDLGRLVAAASLGCACANLLAQTHFDPEAIRLNNRGVAQMGQQFTEKAAASFAEAFKKDPRLAQAEINEGIALMTLQKLDEAKKALHAGARARPEQSRRRGTTWAWRSMPATNWTPRWPAFSRPSRSIRATPTRSTLRASATAT